jgi:hypothetical protein
LALFAGVMRVTRVRKVVDSGIQGA